MITVKLAEIPIGLNNRFPETEALCRGYETLEAPVLTLSVTPEEIAAEGASQPGRFSEGYLESVCLYRKLALEILRHDVFLLHASVLEAEGEGYGFLAPSGTGKTTQTRLWLRHFGPRARVINGDKPLIRVENTSDAPRFLAYGTPWCGKEGLQCNASVPLKALFLLERAEIPACHPAPEEYAVDRLFRQVLMPADPEQMDRLLTMLDLLVQRVPCYRLQCDMTEASVLAALQAVNKAP